jgi:hypothetical protein
MLVETSVLRNSRTNGKVKLNCLKSILAILVNGSSILFFATNDNQFIKS